ncbi:cytochrome c oxidase assembly protein [Vallicoccus soli]|uniref:Cytochrome c oxidase assembly protein n=2 Tax=Vallicoccus soli TaxID=2339232 RepID=A0A3A3Z8U7_9ACTN|nr:cytochrome c oxidase assembly protein [Vallicoccus soli]
MASAVALGVALSRTPPPAGEEVTALGSPAAAFLGYELAPLSAARWVTAWRPDALVLGAVLLAGALYALGVHRLLRRGDRWPWGRSASFAAGLLLVVWVTNGGPGVYGTAMFSMHMVQHMALTMLAPILLTLAAPVTLALRALPAARSRGGQGSTGPREWLLAAVHSRVASFLTHPLVSFGLYVSTLYAFYFTPALAWSMQSHVAHLLMHAHFLGVGLLYLWPIIGVDPAPRRLPHLARMVLLFASMPFHAFFAVAVMSSDDLFARDWFSGLQLPWVDLYADQRLGGGIAWSFAELPALAVLAALFVQWYRHDQRTGERADRRAGADGEAELAAYNARLAALDARSRRQG